MITGHLKNVFKMSFVRYGCLKDVSETTCAHWGRAFWHKVVSLKVFKSEFKKKKRAFICLARLFVFTIYKRVVILELFDFVDKNNRVAYRF